MSMGTRDKMRDADSIEKRVKLLIFATPIGLHGEDFSIKLSFYESLKLMKSLEHFRFMFEKIDPNEFTIVVNETHIILIFPKRITHRSPYI